MESLEIILAFMSRHTYSGLFAALVASSLGFPLAKTLVIMAGGVLASRGQGELYIYMMVSLAGLIFTDLLYYWIGHAGGEAVLTWKIFSREETQQRIRGAEEKFRRHAWEAVFWARFTPYVRTAIYLAAGVARLPLAQFLHADISSACLFTAASAFAGYAFSEQGRRIGSNVPGGPYGLIAGVLVLALIVFLIIRKRGEDRDT